MNGEESRIELGAGRSPDRRGYTDKRAGKGVSRIRQANTHTCLPEAEWSLMTGKNFSGER